jgi:hypothetical protein
LRGAGHIAGFVVQSKSKRVCIQLNGTISQKLVQFKGMVESHRGRVMRETHGGRPESKAQDHPQGSESLMDAGNTHFAIDYANIPRGKVNRTPSATAVVLFSGDQAEGTKAWKAMSIIIRPYLTD